MLVAEPAVFALLDRENIAWCIVHGYDGLPETRGTDIDCIIDRKVPTAMPENGLEGSAEIRANSAAREKTGAFEFTTAAGSNVALHLEGVKRVLPNTPVLANTGVKHATVADVLAVADGCIVGSALKHGGDTWAAVDPDRAADFMARARAARGGK